MENEGELKPMMNYHLIKSKLFEDNSNDYFLSCFTDQEAIKIFTKLALFSDAEKSNEIPKPIPFNDPMAIKWILHVTSYVISLAVRNDSTKIVFVRVILHRFYQKILIDEPKMDNYEYNEVVRTLFLHLSMIFEDRACLELWDIIYKNILTTSINKSSHLYDRKTWDTLFRVVLGLCDYSIMNPDHFSNKSISRFLFSFLFRVLILSTNIIPENWSLFNEYTTRWPRNDFFFNSWQANFMNCFNYLARVKMDISYFQTQFVGDDHPFDSDIVFERIPELAMSVMLQFLISARNLSSSNNYGILHHAFGIIADHIRKHRVEFSPLFQRRWYIDEVFEIFSMWPLASGPQTYDDSDPRENSITSFVMLLDQGLIRKEPKWFHETIRYFKRELKDPESTLAPLLLKRLLKLICNHPITTKDLIIPVLKCCSRQLTTKRNSLVNLDDPVIISLVLTLCEVFLHKSNSIGTISSVQSLLSLLFPRLHDLVCIGSQTWQLHIQTLFVAGCDKNFQTIIDYIEKDPPPEFYLYLMFLPHFFPPFLKGPQGASFVNDIVSASCKFVFNSESKTCAFLFALHEFLSVASRFQPMSLERNLLFDIIRKKDIPPQLFEIVEFFIMSSFSLSQPINPRLFETPQKEHIINFQIDGGLYTFIDEPGDPLKVNARLAYGAFSFVIDEIGSSNEKSPDLAVSIDEQTVKPFPHASSLDGAFSDNTLLSELSEIININDKMHFSQYDQRIRKRSFHKVFSFLANSGIISAENPRSVAHIHGDVTNTIRDYDSLPYMDTIEIGVLHFTPQMSSFPGSRSITPGILRFMDSIGDNQGKYISDTFPIGISGAVVHEIGTLRFVFILRCLLSEEEDSDTNQKLISGLPTLIILNETGCDAIEEEFRKFPSSLIIVTKIHEGNNEPEDGIMLLDVLKNPKKYAFPIIHKMPRLVSKRHIRPVLSLFAVVGTFAESSQMIYRIRNQRKQILSKITKPVNGCNDLLLFSFL